MRIRIKILLILGLIILVLTAGSYAVSETILSSSINALEIKYSTDNVYRFKNNVEYTAKTLSNSVADWAKWDDTYDFMVTNNTSYITSNIVDDTFNSLQINILLYFDPDGNLVLGKLYDLENQTALPLNEATVDTIKSYTELFSTQLDSAQSGLILVEGKPMLVAGHPILTSRLQGPSRGTLIFGHFLDDATISALASIVGLPVTIELYNSTSTGDFEVAKSSLTQAEPIFTQPLSETTGAGYILLDDISGEPLIVARVDDVRDAHAQGKVALVYFSLFLVGMFTVTFCSITFLLDKLVISRISALHNTVTNIRSDGGGSSVRVKDSGDDELSSLCRNINGMLDAIDNNTASLENTVKERTRDLAESKKKIESILAASPDAIVAVDSEGKITECNPRVTELSGFDRSYLIGRRGRDFFSSNSGPDLSEKIAAHFAKNTGFLRFEVNLTKKDGPDVPVEFSVSPIYDENNMRMGSVGIIRDLSEKKQLEQQLLTSQRLAAIGELAGMVGHDIRNPLAAIKNADFYIKKKCSRCKDSQIVLMLNIIDKSIEHANNIVDDLLEYSREQHLEIIDLPARQTIEKALLMVKVPKRIKLVNSVAEEVLKVDEAKALRVFINLTKNAFDAMPEGGTLTITSSRNNEYTMVSFSDTGRGISEEVLSKLFTPLFTTKAQGMGFGLSISKRIVEAHGGKIEVQTAPKKGTTVTVAFSNNPKRTEEDVNQAHKQ